MSLTPAQTATLVSDINGQGSLASARAVHDAPAVCAFYNAASSPAVTIWRNDVKSSEVVAAVVMSEFVALTAVKQQGLMFLLAPGTVDATSANVENAFAAIFAAGTTLTALAALAKRTATRFEALYAAAQGASSVTPLCGIALDADTVGKAMGWWL